MTHSLDPQHQALRLAVEIVIDDLVESGNSLALNDAWVSETINLLLEARDCPEDFLRNTPRLPGSELDIRFPKAGGS